MRYAILLLGLLPIFAACAARPPAASPFPEFAEYAGREVASVELAGEFVVPRDSLNALVVTQASRCRFLGFIPACLFGQGREEHRLDLATLNEDIARIRLYHRDYGYYGTRVVTTVDPLDEERVEVRFLIEAGDRVIVDNLAIQGLEGIIEEDLIRRRLPIREGGPFRRIGFLASSDTIRAELLRRGYAYAQVLRNYSLDTIADVAEAEFEALPGPLVRVDTVLFYGGEGLGERHARRQISIREGDVLRATELAVSQRNLFDLELVDFASVAIAPDTLQLDADSATATVLVQIVEAPRYLVDSSVGIGTVDCIRGRASWTDRNFLGGARRLEVSGELSKIGARSPLDAQLERGVLCEGAGEDRDVLSDNLDHRLAVDFQQPRLFGSRNLFNVRAFSEHVTELNAYLREAQGGHFALVRRVGPQTVLTASAHAENGRTLADPIVFCTGFEVCDPDAILTLQERRWSNWIGVSAVRDRTSRAVGDPNPNGGYQARASVDLASEIFLSDDRYLRLFGDGAAYRQLRPGWILAGRLLGGTFLRGVIGEEGFVPPERRFYAGGPNSVRGFQRNELGPRVYILRTELNEAGEVEAGDTIGAATGGTQTVVGSVELRTPSPVFRSLVRFATFVDAGQVWARGSELESSGLKITPGVGIRVTTPVGPIRLDAAYNPYVPLPGALYVADPSTGQLVRFQERYEPPGDQGFLERVRLHIAVGQAF